MPGFIPLGQNKWALHSFPKISQDPTTTELESEGFFYRKLKSGQQPEVVPFIIATERATTLNKPLQCGYFVIMMTRPVEGFAALQ